MMWIWPVALLCIPCRFVSFCSVSRWHSGRFYLASNLNNQPWNPYFQPCENIMHKKIKPWTNHYSWLIHIWALLPTAFEILPAVTKHVTWLAWLAYVHITVAIVLGGKLSNKRHHKLVAIQYLYFPKRCKVWRTKPEELLHFFIKIFNSSLSLLPTFIFRLTNHGKNVGSKGRLH